MVYLVTFWDGVLMVDRGNEAGIRRVAYEFCEDLFREHVIYAEARLAPRLLAGPKLTAKCARVRCYT